MTDEDLTRAALLTIEEAVHTARYWKEPQTYAVRFALAYLHGVKGGDRAPFDAFWSAINEQSVSRGIALEAAQKALHAHLRIPHREDDMWRVWRQTFARLTTITGQGRRDPLLENAEPQIDAVADQ